MNIEYKPEQIDSTNAILCFDGDYDFLSNFYNTPVEYGGLLYMNSEAAYQAQKTLDMNERIKFTEYHAGKSKREGRKVKLRDDFDEVKDQIMYEICKAKFSQNLELKQKLLDTGDRYIEEGTTGWHDNYWGNCSCEKCKDKIGKNMLGQILMTIRSELRDEIISKTVV